MQSHTHHLPSHTHNHSNNFDHSETNEVELKEGEIICNKCNGSGYDPKYDKSSFFRPICTKCQGEKKLDWVSAATGVAPKEGIWGTGGTSSSSGPGHTHNYNHGNSGCGNITISPNSYHASGLSIEDESYLRIRDKPIDQYIKEFVAQEVANDIDKKILESFERFKEQKQNKKRRKLFDNRIFSKLMLYCNFKQRFKSKKDKDII